MIVAKKRHSANQNTDVFTKLEIFVTKWGNTKEGIVNKAVDDYVSGRENFGKMLAPHLTLENSTARAIFIYDSEIGKTAVVRGRWNDIPKPENERAVLTLKCELCDSDNCIHVRYSLVLPDIIRIRKDDKLV